MHDLLWRYWGFEAVCDTNGSLYWVWIRFGLEVKEFLCFDFGVLFDVKFFLGIVLNEPTVNLGPIIVALLMVYLRKLLILGFLNVLGLTDPYCSFALMALFLLPAVSPSSHIDPSVFTFLPISALKISGDWILRLRKCFAFDARGL